MRAWAGTHSTTHLLDPLHLLFVYLKGGPNGLKKDPKSIASKTKTCKPLTPTWAQPPDFEMAIERTDSQNWRAPNSAFECPSIQYPLPPPYTLHFEAMAISKV